MPPVQGQIDDISDIDMRLVFYNEGKKLKIVYEFSDYGIWVKFGMNKSRNLCSFILLVPCCSY